MDLEHTLALHLQETGVSAEGMRLLAGGAQSVGAEGWQTPSLAPHTFHASGFGVCGNSGMWEQGVGGGAADGEEEDRFLGKCNQRLGGGGPRGSTLDGEGRGGSPSL